MAQKLADQVIDRVPNLDPLADAMQQVIKDALSKGGEPAVAIKDFLHGRWLGHPLHPAIVALPLGAWSATLLFDLTGMEDAADLSLALGIAGATGAALAGLADWSDTFAHQRRIGLIHALLNGTALTLNATSLVLRRQGARPPAVALSSLAYAVGSFSAFLGGELAYSQGVGVNHEAWDMPPSDFTPVLDVSDLREGNPVRAQAGSVAVVVVKRGDDVFALDATCTHAGGPLDQGTVEDDSIICPWHGSKFCLRDGSVERAPATSPAISFEVRLRNDKVEVRPRH